MPGTRRYPPEIRERAVKLVFEHQIKGQFLPPVRPSEIEVRAHSDHESWLKLMAALGAAGASLYYL